MNNNQHSPGEYLKTQVLTASPQQLQLMLYDGAIRFGEQARQAILNREVERSYQLIGRVEKIVLELASSMKDDLAPETCANLRRLYLFCYDRLVQANIKKDLPPLDEALEILRHVRETWILAMQKLRQESNPAIAHHEPSPEPELAGLGSTINLTG